MNNLTQSTAPPRAWTDDAHRKWWYRMGEIFGKPWFEKNGLEPPQLWRESLSRISLQKAAAVLEHYRTAGEPFPPNLSEVMQLASALKQWNPPVTALPPPRGSEMVALNALERMRQCARRGASKFGVKAKAVNDAIEAIAKNHDHHD